MISTSQAILFLVAFCGFSWILSAIGTALNTANGSSVLSILASIIISMCVMCFYFKLNAFLSILITLGGNIVLGIPLWVITSLICEKIHKRKNGKK